MSFDCDGVVHQNGHEHKTRLTLFDDDDSILTNLPLIQGIPVRIVVGHSEIVGDVRTDGKVGTVKGGIKTFISNRLNVLPAPPPDANPTHLLDLVKRDAIEVHLELISIQNCRSTIFLSSIGAITAAIGATGIVAARYYDPQAVSASPVAPFAPVIPPSPHTDIRISAAYWVMIGSGCVATILTVSIAAMIEKAHAVNARRSFLAALTAYIADGKAPPGYRGWANIKDHYPDVVRNQTSTLTWKKIKKMLTIQPYASFTNFSALVFCSLYCVSLLVLLVSLIEYFNSGNIQKALMIGAIASLIGGVPLLFAAYHLPLVASFFNTKNKWILGSKLIFSVAFIAFFGYCVFKEVFSWMPRWDSAPTLSVLLMVASCGLATHFLIEFMKIKVGKHSIESLTACWKTLLERT